MTDARTQIVGAGYDSMADTWEAWRSEVDDDPRGAWLDGLLDRLPERARVLELGCGGGTAETALLAKRFRLTAVDLSAEQLRRAAERVPDVELVQGDLTELDFPSSSFDAVVALYVFNHVPRELLGDVFGRIRTWLAPGGHLLATLGARDLPDWEGEWLGVPMFFSGWNPEVNRELLAEAGLRIVRDDVVTIREPEAEASFHWVHATA